jgi:hypothetical protein
MLNYTCIEGYRFADNTTEFNITCNSTTSDDGVISGYWTMNITNLPQCESNVLKNSVLGMVWGMAGWGREHFKLHKNLRNYLSKIKPILK